MNRGFLATILSLAAFAAALPFAPFGAHAQPVPAAVASPSPDETLAGKGAKKGFLFSAVPFGDSELGKAWAGLRAEAGTKFPDLKLPKVADLHITVVYIGGDWKLADLDRIRPLALVGPASAARMTPDVVRMGRNNQVVAVELHGAPGAWTDSVIAAKNRLNVLGLKKPDNYDTSFRTHVTFAEARHNPPSDAEAAELTAFQAWLGEQVGKDPASFVVTLGSGTRVQLLLAGATRPDDAPEYVTVEDFIARQLGTGKGK